MKIPSRLASLLEQKQSLYGATQSTLAAFDPWLKKNELLFFPDFTDHGVDHIYGVMIGAEALISDRTWDRLTPDDACALVLATLVHDVGMHLTLDGFKSLLASAHTVPDAALYLRDFAEPGWKELWEDFLREALRFNKRRIRELFGADVTIGRPDLGDGRLTLDGCRLIGEFIRRHHPRLAHEIAVLGVPPANGRGRLELKEIEEPTKDLIGLIARSHGMPLRRAVAILRDTHRTRKIHVSYLMAVLRVADYLQIQKERAPSAVLDVRNLRSPISRREWETHEAVVDVHTEHADSEAINVEADPKNAVVWSKLRRLIESIQAEIDISWAVLGEKRVSSDGAQFGLTLRRIRSNLDDEESFARDAPFVPIHARFRSSDGELLKLLVKPLYAGRPEYGIRELVQNAVDACGELKDYLERHTLAEDHLPEQDADVVVSVWWDERDGPCIEVSDRGIGMTPETIRDYFLTAGASYRNTAAWQKLHLSDAGPRVTRAGRFGVGALATYLLGDEIEVSTRHATQKRGVRFTCGIDDEVVDLRWSDRPVGTTVRIKLAEGVFEDLTRRNRGRIEGSAWDWWCLATPSVKRTVFLPGEAQGVQLVQRFSVCDGGEHAPRWRQLRNRQNDIGVCWTYSHAAPGLICNGIRVQSADFGYEPAVSRRPLWTDEAVDEDRLVFRTPNVRVTDPNACFPLDLLRSEVESNRYPFEGDLVQSVCADVVEYCCLNAPKAGFRDPVFYESAGSFLYPGLDMDHTTCWYLCLERGIVPNEASFTGHLGRSLVLAQPIDWMFPFMSHLKEPVSMLPLSPGPFGTSSPRNPSPIEWILLLLYGPGSAAFNRFSQSASLTESILGAVGRMRWGGRRLYISTAAARVTPLRSLREDSSVTIDDGNNGWLVLSTGTCPPMDVAPSEMPGLEREATFAVWYAASDQASDSSLSPLGAYWLERLGHSVIPYDPEERRIFYDASPPEPKIAAV